MDENNYDSSGEESIIYSLWLAIVAVNYGYLNQDLP